MNPDQLLAALAEVYATCATYKDSGEVVTRFRHSNGRPRTDAKPFATAFVRPDRFRFEYRHRYNERDDWDRCIVWAAGSDVRVWWDVRPGVERPESLVMALAGATGVSGGSAHTVPSLLMPDARLGSRVTQLADLTAMPDETLDGVACYRLVGRVVLPPLEPGEAERRDEEVRQLTGRRMPRAEHGPRTLWVDRGTLLIRRIDEAVNFETFSTETVTTYAPKVGVAISEDDLRFDPPEHQQEARA